MTDNSHGNLARLRAMPPTLSHFTVEPIESVYSVEQPIKEAGEFSPYKPKGLWVSVDGEDDWPSWCKAEDYSGLHGIRYRVEIDPEKVLWLRYPEELLLFTKKYGSGRYIDWVRAAGDHGGLVISPYQWSLRLDNRTHWYYGWDCASGCIWDKTAIISLTRDDSEPEPPE